MTQIDEIIEKIDGGMKEAEEILFEKLVEVIRLMGHLNNHYGFGKLIEEGKLIEVEEALEKKSRL